MVADRIENKVERVFSNSSNDRVEAVLYRQVDPIGITMGFLMHLVFSGEKIYHTDLDEVLRYQPEASK